MVNTVILMLLHPLSLYIYIYIYKKRERIGYCTDSVELGDYLTKSGDCIG